MCMRTLPCACMCCMPEYLRENEKSQTAFYTISLSIGADKSFQQHSWGFESNAMKCSDIQHINAAPYLTEQLDLSCQKIWQLWISFPLAVQGCLGVLLMTPWWPLIWLLITNQGALGLSQTYRNLCPRTSQNVLGPISATCMICYDSFKLFSWHKVLMGLAWLVPSGCNILAPCLLPVESPLHRCWKDTTSATPLSVYDCFLP